MADRFVAVVNDATNSQNPAEQVEVDLEEVSTSDLPLLAEGATFYWCIGYRDTPGGQRERISTLRFARQPHLSKTVVSKTVVDRAFALADRVATAAGARLRTWSQSAMLEPLSRIQISAIQNAAAV
jgi:hypothetical protein